MIFWSLWCSLFPFVFLEPKPAYCHPCSPLSSLGQSGTRRKQGRGRSVGQQGRSWGHGCTAAFQRQREKGVRCKLTTGCRLARANRASVLTALGGVLEKSPGICSGQSRDPPQMACQPPVGRPRSLPLRGGLVGVLGGSQIPRCLSPSPS